MENKKNLYESITAFLILAVAIVISFLAHRVAVFMMDDLWYANNLATLATMGEETGAPLKSVRDIYESQVWHYLNWGGRSVTHTILQFVLMGGELFADILNVVMTCVISTLIVVISSKLSGTTHTFARSAIYVGTVYGLLHGLNANWHLSMYWQSGSVNYLYITSFILLFMWCYVRELSDERPAALKGITVWIVPLAIITGWSNENMGPTAWLISVFTIGYLCKKKTPLKPWMILGSLFSLVGSAACILAPGNFVRSAYAENDTSLLMKLFLRAYSEVRSGFDYMFAPVIVVLFLLIIFYPVLKNKWDLRVLVLLAAAVVSWGAMILSPHYPDRATFGTMILLLTVIVSLVMGLHKQKPELKWWLNGAMAVIWIRGMFWLVEYLASAAGMIK